LLNTEKLKQAQLNNNISNVVTKCNPTCLGWRYSTYDDSMSLKHCSWLATLWRRKHKYALRNSVIYDFIFRFIFLVRQSTIRLSVFMELLAVLTN